MYFYICLLDFCKILSRTFKYLANVEIGLMLTEIKFQGKRISGVIICRKKITNVCSEKVLTSMNVCSILIIVHRRNGLRKKAGVC